jgi:hypothetical protein
VLCIGLASSGSPRPGLNKAAVLAVPAAYDFARWRTSGMTRSQRPVPQRDAPPRPVTMGRRDPWTGQAAGQPLPFSHLMCGGYCWAKRHGS